MVRTLSSPALPLLSLAAAVWLLAGCGGDEPGAPPPGLAIESFTVSPAHLDAPGDVSLEWTTVNASAVELRQNDEPLDTGDAVASGSMVVSLVESATFTLIASNAAGDSISETRQVTVDASPLPRIGSFTAAEVVQADEAGEAAITATWSGVEDADELSLQISGRAPIELDANAAEGSHDLVLSEDATLTLVATNAFGEASATAAVRLVPIPTIARFTADRSFLGSGESTTVQWEATGAAHLELWIEGVLLHELEAAEGSVEVPIDFTSTLELRAFNELDAVATATLVVEVGTPEAFEVEISSSSLWLGETATFTWLSEGGSELAITIDGTGEIVCEIRDRSRVDDSSCDWLPEEAGFYSLTFTVSNASGLTTRLFDVFVGTGPVITHFAVAPTTLVAGDEIELEWAVHPDPAGNEATLHLEDDRGNTYRDAEGREGRLVASLAVPGTYRITLEATTDHPSSEQASETVEIQVHPRPEVEFVATPPLFDDTVDEDVVISWRTRDAASVLLYELVGGERKLLLEATGETKEEGSYRFVPREDTSFVLVVTDALGGANEAELEVRVAPVEVLSVEVSPTTFTQGQEVELSWATRMADEVSINIGTKNYLLEESLAPYLDLPEHGGELLPLTQACGGPIESHGCAELAFPSGFNFPFDGAGRDRVWVYTPGYLSFDDKNPADTILRTTAFPTDPSAAGISLAPFWSRLNWDPVRYPVGNVYHALLEEDGERIFVIQWKDVGYFTTTGRNASFNHEVVLREDGSFEFRYGPQLARDSGLDMNALGATIGFQLPSQLDAGMIYQDQLFPMLGGRQHRSFTYKPAPPLAASGELRFAPYGPEATFPITITATRDGVSHSESVMVTVSRKPIIELATETIPPAPLGEDFVLGWHTSNASALVIVDEADEVRYTAGSQAEVEEGVIVLNEEREGRHRYTLRATGAHGAVTERHVFVQVFGDFGVVSFDAAEDSVEPGGDVTLFWEVFEAASITIFGDGVELYSDDSGASSGSFVVDDVRTETEFKLVVTNAVGVEDEATVSVEIWDLVIGMTASATRARPGDTITVDIDARSMGDDTPLRVYGLLPMGERGDKGSRYQDISSHPTAKDLQVNPSASSSVIDIELPFAFPYMGEEHGRLRAFVDGYISFNMTAANWPINQRFPFASGQSVNVHLAPFWDDLHPHGIGKMHTASPSAESFVIQWSQMSFNRGANSANPQNMNFQLVLFRDGSFEYRYGVMEPHPTYEAHFDCHPATCVNEVNGSAATIGYQFANGARGHNHHFGGTSANPANLPVAGGLSNRTFRYSVVTGSGSFSFQPQETETFSLCAVTTGEPRCKPLHIEVDFGLESVSLSKAEVGFGESVTVSWESVGGKVLNILDGDQIVFSTSTLSEVDQGSAALRPPRDLVYTVELLAGNRRDSMERRIDVNRMELTASATNSSGAGEPVTLSWTWQNTDSSLEAHLVSPMEELPDSSFAFYDITTHADSEILIDRDDDRGNATLEFEDFTFPYFGTEHDHIRVTTDGYLTWDFDLSMGGNVSIPDAHSGARTKSILVFWDDLHTRADGRVLAKKFDADRYVIQWHHMSLRWGSANANQGDLNFLVVLHRDGSFEFHFGRMDPPRNDALPNECMPVSCVRESNGSSATIGYQVPGGLAGYQLHFGGTNRGLEQPIVAGGLAHRAWKFTSRTSAGPGSAVVHPASSTNYRVCAYDPVSTDVRCAPTVRVEVPWGIDLFQANPEAPKAGESVALSWSVQGAESLRLLADGNLLVAHTAPGVPLLGSFEHTPNGATVYTLEIASMGRVVVEERRVVMRTFELEVSAASGTFLPGEHVTVDWKITTAGASDVVVTSPMSEVVELADAFSDISGVAGATERTLVGELVGFDLPFPFPFLGTTQTRVEVYARGYLSFAGIGDPARQNDAGFPASAGKHSSVHIAPFWDSLALRGGESIWTHAPDATTFIIQWTGGWELRFPLWEDGSSSPALRQR